MAAGTASLFHSNLCCFLWCGLTASRHPLCRRGLKLIPRMCGSIGGSFVTCSCSLSLQPTWVTNGRVDATDMTLQQKMPPFTVEINLPNRQ